MSTVSRRTLVRAAAVTACAGSLLALPTAAALAEGVPAASSARSAAPQLSLVKSLSLADGTSTAKVYRTTQGGYHAEILAADGTRAATLTSHGGVTGFGGTGELHAALDSTGRLTSWVGDAPAPGADHTVDGDGYKTGTRTGAHGGHVVPASVPQAAQQPAAGSTRTVAEGAGGGRRLSTLADGPGEGVLLLAAAGGIAAVGAAGLGFAMLRRGRTDG
ncbi:hypothetical protein B6R96_11955 [Streptomyces sp. Sge12]|uniref:hypothetical protein n=1 Tax=Streptomyces sp. Sge12 TaxID=1972846 RepID=UPI0009C3CA13|nr:hypothetical protein [Streptomyces sp. Sge12]ARE74570.1 hypothetical protein B6R96_11955 [Streptomyces sp. Sge12]